MHYIIAYDITDNKKRNKLSTLLDKYGIRVNYSVYECQFNKTKLKNLISKIKELNLYDKKRDSIRFYHIHKNSINNSFELSNKPQPFEALDMFV